MHLRTPGQEHEEDIASGTAAAAAGGFAAILAMPNTDPVVDSASVMQSLHERAQTEAAVAVGFIGAISLGQRGEQLAELGALADAGAVGFSDDGRPVESAGLLRRAFQYASITGRVLSLHCEELSLTRGSAMHEGAVSALLGIGGYPSIGESLMVARDLRIARYEDQPIHLCHLHVLESVEEVRHARTLGVDVSAEASPHHLLLTDEDVRTLDPNLRMSPPLARERDRRALIDALRDGAIDCVATDHAPHAPEEKDVPFEAAANGTTGLETAFPALYRGLVEPGLLDLATLVTRMTSGPARAFGLETPRIAVGAPANAHALGPRRALRRQRVRPALAEPELRLPRPRGHGPVPPHPRRRPGRPSTRPRDRVTGAALYLADGSAFPAVSVGAPACAVGEAVFTTGMTGYQESLTDPSFYGQLLCFTAPMIGNYGVEAAAEESPSPQVRALLCHEARNAAPAGRRGLLDWLKEHDVVVLAELDTRALVRHLRDRGAMLAVAVGDGRSEAEARALLAAEPAMTGRSLADAVSGLIEGDAIGSRCRVVVVDYGTKASIVHLLEQAGASVEVVRHDASAAEILALEPDGVLLANGPGDPGAMDSHAAEVRFLIDSGRPVFGICLGHQLVGRALGLETYKLPFGHRGANHPVLERATGPRARHEPEPRLRGARARRRGRRPRSMSRTSRCTTRRSRGCACAGGPSGACSSTPRRRRARTTRGSSSSASSTPARPCAAGAPWAPTERRERGTRCRGERTSRRSP